MTGLFAPDGSLYVAESDGRGVYHACGAYNYTAAEDDTTFGHYAPDGSMYLSFTLGDSGIYAPNGALRADAGVPAWTPADLFALAQPGIFLDGSDNSVMWQDAAGTTPVTALGQSVGLVLDKRLWGGKTLAQMLAEQPELVTNGGGPFVSTDDWTTQDFNVSLSIDAGRLRLDFAGASSYAYTSLPTIAGESYAVEVEFELGSNATAGRMAVRDQTASGTVIVGESDTQSASSPIRFFFTALSAVSVLRAGFEKENPATAYVHRVSVKHVPGNHASQSTSASCPVWQEDDLGARGLLFDGVDDNLATPSIDFSASDKVMAAAGVRKLSDATTAVLAELSASATTNDGIFLFAAPLGAGSPDYRFRSKGTTEQTALYTNASVAAPTSNVLVGLGDIGGDISRLRVDGVQVAETTGDQGTGNYGNYPLYIGRRGGSTLPYNGFLHQLVIRGGVWPNAAELAQLEAYLASKSKVAI